MKGNEALISSLNELLSDELSAINQYMVHSEMCDNWGYSRLHKSVEKRAIDEMKHAEKLIARILFLNGLPIVSKLKDLNIGAVPAQQINNDMQSELGAIAAYNAAVKLANDVGDAGTRELLEDILEDEEEHLDWLEAQEDQISQMGVQIYLSGQTRE